MIFLLLFGSRGRRCAYLSSNSCFCSESFIAFFTHGLQSDLNQSCDRRASAFDGERQAKCSHEFAAPLQMHPAGRERSVSFARKSSEQNRLLFYHVLSSKLSLLIFFFKLEISLVMPPIRKKNNDTSSD